MHDRHVIGLGRRRVELVAGTGDEAQSRRLRIDEQRHDDTVTRPRLAVAAPAEPPAIVLPRGQHVPFATIGAADPTPVARRALEGPLPK